MINRYQHGGNVLLMVKELGIPLKEIIDFSASINPLGTPRAVKRVLKENLNLIAHYPDSGCNELRKVIAEVHGIEQDSILVGNGSTELIYLIPQALRPQNVLIPAPTFSEYERAVVRAQGTEHRTQIKYLILKEEDDFEINADEFISAMRGDDSIDMGFLCNPNNPTGGLLKRDKVLEVAETAKMVRCLLIVDEAFIDFCPEDSVISEVQNNPYLIVLRSMTKFYALAGLRVGYGVFHSSLIKKLREFKEPWTVNSLAQEAAIAALGDSIYVNETLKLITNEKRFLESGFREAGIEFFPSDANFYLLKINDNRRIKLRLRQKGIIVRDCSNFYGLGDSYIRVAVKNRRDNALLLEVLKDSLRKEGGEKQ